MKAKYLFLKDVFDKNVTDIRKAFSKRCMNVVLGYSVKTNNDPIVIEEARRMKMKAEIVSADEFKLAVQCGYSVKDIIFNGVSMDVKEKVAVAEHGGMVNLDSLYELERFIDVAKERSITNVNIGMRLNVDIGSPYKSRFGIDAYSDEYNKFVNLAKSSREVNLTGIHVHIHACRELPWWKQRVKTVCEIAKELNVHYIDFGSNFYGAMDDDFKKQFNDTYTYDEFAYNFFSEYVNVCWVDDKQPTIILEPGTPVVANAVNLMCEVINIKENNGKKYAVVNASKFDMGFLWMNKQAPIDVIHNGTNEIVYNDIDIVGNTCVEADCLYPSYKGKLAIGDIIVFKNVGAYTSSMRNHFITEPLGMIDICGGYGI